MPYNVPRHTGLLAHPALERARASAMTGAARRAARALEQQGRGSDRHLIHVTDGELTAIRSAFGPAGGAGRRNPATGLESFAPDTATSIDDTFPSTNPDGSGYRMRLPLDAAPADAAAAAGFNLLRTITPRAPEQTTIQDQTPVFSTPTGFPLLPTPHSLDSGVNVAAVSPAPDTAPQQAQSSSSGAIAPPASPPAGAVPVALPNGQTLRVSDEQGQETELLSPVPDLSHVAAAGRETAQRYRAILNGTQPGSALPYLIESLISHVGPGGLFDYQREGNQIQGNLAEGFPSLFLKFKQHPAYQPVANFDVGLFCQQAGLSLEETLRTAGGYAWLFSSNAKSDQPDNLDPEVRQYIIQGWKAGDRGDFDPLAQKTGQ